MASKYYKKLWEYSRILMKEGKYRGWMCIYEGFNDGYAILRKQPFKDHIQSLFPVLEGTPFAFTNTLTPQLVEMLGTLSQIPDKDNFYEKKVDYMLELPLTKEMFEEHSLFLLKEHCKLFSPYCKKLELLLEKLEKLE